MKRRPPWTFLVSLWILIAHIGSAITLAEDEDEELPFPSQLETIRFLERDLPIAIDVLEIVKREEGERPYERVLESYQEVYFEFQEIRRYEGRGAAALFLERHRLETRIDKLLHDYFEVAETDEERQALKAEIRDLVKQQLEHDKRSVELQIRFLDRERKTLTQELEELKDVGQEEIDERVEDLLN
ncbi:MAG: hypothetical protein AAGB46_18995 [Verrucomicrobiota bacterium]